MDRIGVRRRLIPVVLAILAMLMLTRPAVGHHGWSWYNNDVLTTLTGVVEEVSFGNPHGYIRLNAEGQIWNLTLAPPGRMLRANFTREVIAVGDEATVEGHVNLNDPTEMKVERVTVRGVGYQLY